MLITIRSNIPGIYEIISDCFPNKQADGINELINAIESITGKEHKCSIDEDKVIDIIEEYLDDNKDDIVNKIKEKFLAQKPK